MNNAKIQEKCHSTGVFAMSRILNRELSRQNKSMDRLFNARYNNTISSVTLKPRL